MRREFHEGFSGLVSIIMPAYNCEAYISEAIESVLAQTYDNFELIICDDCSRDGTKEILLSYEKKDSRLKVIFNSENQGTALSRNRCIKYAKGEFIAFLDSDDIWLPNKLYVQIGFMQTYDAPFTCTEYFEADEKLEKVICRVIPYREADYWKILFSGNPLGNSTVIYNATQLGKFYAPDVRKRNDFALWLDISKCNVKAIGISEPLTIYRRRKGSLSSSKFQLLGHQWNLYRKIEQLTVPVSVVAMMTWSVVKVLKINKSKASFSLKKKL